MVSKMGQAFQEHQTGVGDSGVVEFHSLPCERIAIGEPDDYQPCTARLPDGELLLSCFDQHPANSRPGFQEF